MRRSPLLLLLAAAAAAALAAAGWSRSTGDGDGGARGGQATEGPARVAQVVRVVDGDTIVVRAGGRTERVRYIGIDTPESVKPGAPVECFAKDAARENRRLVGGRQVRLVPDVERRDRFGRLLAYVYRAEDGRFVNAALLRDGFAQPLTIPPNVRHAARFRALAAEARRMGRGLWSTCAG